MRLDVPVGKAACRHRRLRCSFLTGVCFDCGEADEPARRALHGTVWPRGVDLADLAAPPVAGVAHPYADGDILASGGVTGGLDTDVLPSGVAEAMAERVQRLTFVAVVGTVADEQTLVVGEDAVDWLRRGQHLGERVAELLPGKPGEQHRRDLIGPGQEYRRAGVDDHYGPRISFGDAADELVLPTGQIERVAIEALALDFLGSPHQDDGYIGVPRQRRGSFELLLFRYLPGDVELERDHGEVSLAEPSSGLRL